MLKVTKLSAIAQSVTVGTAFLVGWLAVPSQAQSVGPVSEDVVTLGRELYQGTIRFTNGGPACNSCHEVTNDSVIGGGVLGRELTTVFSRFGGPAIRVMIGSPPLPVMQRAFQGRPLTEEEVEALVGFLERADAEHELHQPRDYGIKLFGSGAAGTTLLLGVYTVLWRKRKRGSVNQAIFDRQVRSS